MNSVRNVCTMKKAVCLQIALLTTKPRQATVSAEGVLKCLSLDRRTFTRVMGALQDILMRNMAEYNKFQASNI